MNEPSSFPTTRRDTPLMNEGNEGLKVSPGHDLPPQAGCRVANHEGAAATSRQQASPCSTKATRATRKLVGEPLFNPVEWSARLKQKITDDGWSYRKEAKEVGITSASLHRAASGKTPDVETFLRCELWMAPSSTTEGVTLLATILGELDGLYEDPNTPPGIRNFVGHRIDALRITLRTLGIPRPATKLPARGWPNGDG